MNKKVLVFGMTLVLLAIILTGCSETDNPLSGLSYQNSQHGFGLNPPEDWTVDENDPYGAVRFYGPTIEGATVNIGISEPSYLATGESLESTVISIVEYYASYFTDFSEVSNSSRTVNGMNAHDLVYTFTQDALELKQMQVLIEKNRKSFVITFTASLPLELSPSILPSGCTLSFPSESTLTRVATMGTCPRPVMVID